MIGSKGNHSISVGHYLGDSLHRHQLPPRNYPPQSDYRQNWSIVNTYNHLHAPVPHRFLDMFAQDIVLILR